jgi:hypothetical protein
MNGDADLGQNIIMKGDKFHYLRQLAAKPKGSASGSATCTKFNDEVERLRGVMAKSRRDADSEQAIVKVWTKRVRERQIAGLPAVLRDRYMGALRYHEQLYKDHCRRVEEAEELNSEAKEALRQCECGHSDSKPKKKTEIAEKHESQSKKKSLFLRAWKLSSRPLPSKGKTSS